MTETQPDGEKINLLQQEVNELIEREDMQWRQRAKEHWLRNGDKNTKFFHASVIQRCRANQIVRIENEDGVLCSTPAEITKVFTDYFQNIFSTTNPCGIRECLNGLERKVTHSMNEQLVKELIVDEINCVISQMGAQKASGPDVLLACFYHDNWLTIGDEVYNVVKKNLIRVALMLM